jgi:hypothetical protein
LHEHERGCVSASYDENRRKGLGGGIDNFDVFYNYISAGASPFFRREVDLSFLA